MFLLNARQVGEGERAGERAAAEIRSLIPHALLVAEPDDLKVERQFHAAFTERLHGGEGGEHAQRAVVFPGVAHGVEVRAEQQRFRAALRGFPAAEQVEGRVHAHLQPGLAHPGGDEFVRVAHGGRGERAREAAALVADLRERLAAAQDELGELAVHGK